MYDKKRDPDETRTRVECLVRNRYNLYTTETAEIRSENSGTSRVGFVKDALTLYTLLRRVYRVPTSNHFQEKAMGLKPTLGGLQYQLV